MFRLAIVVVVLGTFSGLHGQTPRPSEPAVSLSPAQLPGKGLGQHDFLYAGESRDRKIFIVRQGKIVWSYDDPAVRSAMR